MTSYGSGMETQQQQLPACLILLAKSKYSGTVCLSAWNKYPLIQYKLYTNRTERERERERGFWIGK